MHLRQKKRQNVCMSMPVCVCLCASMSLCLCLLVSVSVGRSVSRSAGRADGRSLSVGRSIYVWTYLPIYLSIYLYRYLFFRQGWGGSDLSVSLSLSLPSFRWGRVRDGPAPRRPSPFDLRRWGRRKKLCFPRSVRFEACVFSLALSPPLSSLRFFASPEKSPKVVDPRPGAPLPI